MIKLFSKFFTKKELVYQYRLKGTEAWIPCSKDMYDKLTGHFVTTYETRIAPKSK